MWRLLVCSGKAVSFPCTPRLPQVRTRGWGLTRAGMVCDGQLRGLAWSEMRIILTHLGSHFVIEIFLTSLVRAPILFRTVRGPRTA